MCKATHEPGGPRRCSGDTRSSYTQSANAVAVLEKTEAVLKSALGAPAPAAPAAGPISFGDKTTRNEDIRREIDEAITNLNTGEQWTSWLEYASRFHNYSFNNQLLIQMQYPTASQVAGFHRWKDLGRNVEKGSKAIWIWAPKNGLPASIILKPL